MQDNSRKSEILQWPRTVVYKYTGSQEESGISDMPTTTVKTIIRRCKTQSSFQLIQCLKRILKPKHAICYLVAPETWCFVPVEHSHSGNDSPASCSVNGSRMIECMESST